MIKTSFYLPVGAVVTDFSLNLINDVTEEDIMCMVRNVRYNKNITNDVETIVDSISQKVIFRLSNNPNVIKITNFPDIELAFYIKSELPGAEESVVYIVNSSNNYVYRISHIYLEWVHGANRYWNFILGVDPQSCSNIINYLKSREDKPMEGILVKKDNVWIPFSDILPESFFPENKDNKTSENM